MRRLDGVVRGLAVFLAALALGGAASSLAATDEEDGYVYIGRGTLGRYSEWSAWLESGKHGSRQASGVCLSVDIVEPPVSGLVSENEIRECGGLGLRAPLLQVIPARVGGGKADTVVAIVAPPAMRKIRLLVGTGEKRTMRLIALKPVDASRIGVRPVVYVAHAFPGRLCVHGVVLYGAGRSVTIGSQTAACR